MAYKKPLLNFLSEKKPEYDIYKKAADEHYANLLSCFKSFKVKVSQEGYKISPINMVFNFKLDTETPFKAVKSLEPELAMYTGGYDVKVFRGNEESRVFSVSIPRGLRSYVGLGEIIKSPEYKEMKTTLPIAVGVNELGRNEILDLENAPHLLISGTTGSGKTVYLDDVILSILYRSSPNMVKFVLVDPSAKDFLIYQDLPHLLFPIASDKSTIYEVVKYVRNRMDERYRRLAKKGKRNIQNYEGRGKSYFSRIVVIIDKYLELTYEMPSDFEDCVNEIARKGRAAGIHLVINSQSARSEVISGNIKNNIPARVAFSVTDWLESKAILDKTGAQKLLGNGDMLYVAGLQETPKHIQAPNVSLEEIEKVVANVIERNGRAKYVNEFNDTSEPVEDNIELIQDVLEKLNSINSVDVELLQNQFNLDFAEAIDVIKFLESNDLVSGFENKKGRRIDHEAVQKMLNELDEV